MTVHRNANLIDANMSFVVKSLYKYNGHQYGFTLLHRRFLLVQAEPAHKINICGGGLEYSTMI